MGLPPEDRQTIAFELLASIPPCESDDVLVFDPALEDEIQRRIAQRDAGRARVVDIATFAATLSKAAHPPHAS